MSVNEIPAIGGPTPPGDAFPRAADIFDREAFALRLADARRRRARVLAERAAATRMPPAPLLQPAALPPMPAAAVPPPAARRRHWLPAMAGVAALGAALLLLRPGGPLTLPVAGPAPVVLAAPATDSTGVPLLPRGLAPARVTPAPGALGLPRAETARDSDATSWVPKPMARPDGLRRIVPPGKRRAAVADPPPVVRGVARFLGRIGIRPVAPRPAGQRTPGA